MATYRILLVHRDVFLRQGLKQILCEKPDIEVIGEAVDASQLMGRVLFKRRPGS